MPIDVAAMARHHRLKLVHLLGADDAVIVATTMPSVVYSSGYRSTGYDANSAQAMAVVFDANRHIIVGPTVDLWGAREHAGSELTYYGYGTFFFDDAEALTHSATEFVAFGSYPDALEAAIATLAGGMRRLALEGGGGSIAGLYAMPSEDVALHFRTARALKDDYELALLRHATAVTDAALSSALAHARAGVSELDLAAILSSEMIRHGVQPGFLVVTAGPRSAFSDVNASARRLEPGDLVRFDIGGTVAGYWSDTACTANVGEPDRTVRNINAALVASHLAAFESIKPHVPANEVFETALAVAHREGLSRLRRHHVGHGLGLQSHEYPTLSAHNTALLEPGMVVNVEVPYYRPGWGGIMYEDTMLITESGVERFTTRDAGLIILPA